MAADKCQVLRTLMKKLYGHCTAFWEVIPEALISVEEDPDPHGKDLL